MKLYIKCNNCNSNISFWSWAMDRVELKKSVGDRIELKCKKCNKDFNYYINDLKAKESKIALIIALIIFIIGTPIMFILLWDYIWQTNLYALLGILTPILIPSMIYTIIHQNDRKRVSLFNGS